MVDEVQKSLSVLRDFAKQQMVDRDQVVAFATLWALCDHWPLRATAEIKDLVAASQEIFMKEKDRCLKQRRIAVAEIARAFDQAESLLPPPHNLQRST